jgi:hypothetical protein
MRLGAARSASKSICGAHVTCTSPADTLLDHGTGDTVTACHLVGNP